MRRLFSVTFAIALASVLVACGGGGGTTPTGALGSNAAQPPGVLPISGVAGVPIVARFAGRFGYIRCNPLKHVGGSFSILGLGGASFLGAGEAIEDMSGSYSPANCFLEGSSFTFSVSDTHDVVILHGGPGPLCTTVGGQFLAEYKIIGGTGKFAKATGSVTDVITCTSIAPGSGTFTDAWSGTITY